MKKIKTIHLQRFRQFSDTKISVRDFNLLVGPNNCGKTSILHAIKSFFLLMHGHVKFEGSPPVPKYHRRFLSGSEEIAPTPDTRELWFNLQTGKPITVTITFDDDISFTLSLRQQFGQIHVSADNLPEGVTSNTIKTYLGQQVAYIPGLVGVLVSEPYSTGARRNALANQGRYSEIFRSSLHQLKTKDEDLLNTINEWLSLLFDKSISSVDFNPDSDEYVTVKYNQNGTSFDVVSSGSGLQQVIQMLTYLYISRPNILLIDEPDAHLHSKLQSRLGELFKRVATDLNAQVFLSTHSVDLIDTFSTRDVIVVDSSQKELAPIGDDRELVSTLIDSDIIDVSALSRLLSSRKLVVVEDKDQTVMKAIDRACGSPLYSSKSDSYVLSAKGVSNFRAVADLGKVLSGLIGTKFDITFIQDRDGMPDFIVDKFCSSQSAEGVRAHLLDRHEIENYLIEPRLFAATLEKCGKALDIARIEEIIVESAQTLRAEARQASMKCAELVNRHLQQDKLKDKDLEIEVHRWFDQLDLSQVDVIVKVFPGKELLSKVITNINEVTGAVLTRGKLVSEIDESFIAEDIITFLKEHALEEKSRGHGTTRKISRLRRRTR